MYEGLFHKLANKNLAVVDRACGRDCLSGGSNRGPGGSSRGGTGGGANGAQYDLDRPEDWVLARGLSD
jgi:uncharacterized membrane protein